MPSLVTQTIILIVGLVANLGLKQIAANEAEITYHMSQVWRTTLKTVSDFRFFEELETLKYISIWKATRTHVDYLLLADKRPNVEQYLKEHALNHTILIKYVQKRIDESKVTTPAWTAETLQLGYRLLHWPQFPTMEMIDEFFNFLKENYPSICNVTEIGKSAENRPIMMVKVSNRDPSNKPIVITAGSHGNEWISVTSSLYLLDIIVTKFDKLPAYMQDKDWYIIPLVNPDGYQYTLTTDRFWRKNRRVVGTDNCIGVDIARNWAFEMDPKQNEDACLERYPGPSPFSEPETAAVRRVLESIKDQKDNAAYVDVHSYGQSRSQRIMYPWGSGNQPSEHAAQLEMIAAGMSQAAFNKSGRVRMYEHGSVSQMLPNVVTGLAIDWVHAFGIRPVFMFDARDTGSNGLLISNDQIERTGIELLAATKHLAKTLQPKPTMRSEEKCHSWF